VILAAVLLKMGTYGFLRFAMALFPVAATDWTPVIATLAVIGILYGALVAMVQKDVKKLVAYSSVSHLGFVMLGLFAFNLQGIEGAILQMVNHGISTGALFLIVGIIYERRHTRLISEFGGLAKVVPVFCLCFMVVTLSSIGVPGTNGFVGEFLILLGAFKVQKWYAVVAATGVIFAAVYMLWMFQRVMYGKITNEENLRLADMNGREVAYMLPLLLFILWIGIYPQPFLRRMDASVNAFVTRFEAKKQAALAGSPAGETMLVRYFDVKKGGAR
jgi:NADH-quinone oxidoreductase subunit M